MIYIDGKKETEMNQKQTNMNNNNDNNNKNTSEKQEEERPRIIILFGAQTNMRMNEVHEFDLKSQTWKKIIPKKLSGHWESRWHATCCLKGKYIYIFGNSFLFVFFFIHFFFIHFSFIFLFFFFF